MAGLSTGPGKPHPVWYLQGFRVGSRKFLSTGYVILIVGVGNGTRPFSTPRCGETHIRSPVTVPETRFSCYLQDLGPILAKFAVVPFCVHSFRTPGWLVPYDRLNCTFEMGFVAVHSFRTSGWLVPYDSLSPCFKTECVFVAFECQASGLFF